jgi:hypothetical protein
MIADLMILHRKSGAKSSNRHLLPFLRFAPCGAPEGVGGRGRGMGGSDHEPKQVKEAELEGGKCLDNHKG